MVQVVQARRATLGRLEAEFGLVPNPQGFTECIASEVHLTNAELQTLSRIKSNAAHLLKEPPILEQAAKMVVLSPLLDLAGFYQPPFQIKLAAVSLDATQTEAGSMIRAEMDVWVISKTLWVLAFDSKLSAIASLHGYVPGFNVVLPQALSYMLSSSDQPCYGLIVNGSDFIFVKLNQEETPQYATSRVFSLVASSNELIEVLKILKHIARLVVREMAQSIDQSNCK